MALMLAPGRRPGQRSCCRADGYYNTAGARRAGCGRTAPKRSRPDLARPRRASARRCRAGPSVLWAETPTNPLLRVADLGGARRAGRRARRHRSSSTTRSRRRCCRRPLDFGALPSLYSLTKSVSGHSDVLGGAVVTRDTTLARDLRTWRTAGGAHPGPFESWLVLRGHEDPAAAHRRAQSANALAVAALPGRPPAVTRRALPGLGPSAAAIGADAARLRPAPVVRARTARPRTPTRVVAAARLDRCPATSLGGVESTWERRARWRGRDSARRRSSACRRASNPSRTCSRTSARP